MQVETTVIPLKVSDTLLLQQMCVRRKAVPNTQLKLTFHYRTILRKLNYKCIAKVSFIFLTKEVTWSCVFCYNHTNPTSFHPPFFTPSVCSAIRPIPSSFCLFYFFSYISFPFLSIRLSLHPSFLLSLFTLFYFPVYLFFSHFYFVLIILLPSFIIISTKYTSSWVSLSAERGYEQ